MLRFVRNVIQLPDLRRKIGFTLLILAIFRLMAQVPALEVDQEQINDLLADNLLAGLLDLLAGGEVLTGFSIFATGVLPYIVASQLMGWLVPLFPALESLAEEGEAGRERIDRYARWLAIPLALMMAWGTALFLDRQIGLFPGGVRFFTPQTFLPTVKILSTVTAASVLSVWLSDLIDESGIGKGTSVVILGGACLSLFKRVSQIVTGRADWVGALQQLAVLGAVGIVVIVVSIYIQEGQRRIPVDYGRRVRGTRVYGSRTSIPLRVNPGGINSIIMAHGLLIWLWLIGIGLTSVFDGFIGALGDGIIAWLDPRGWFYWLVLFCLIVLFTYLYNVILLERQQLHEMLRIQGGFIPGIRPGEATGQFLTRVQQRITLMGALGMGFLAAVLPYAVQLLTNQRLAGMILSLVLTVGIVTDVLRQLEAQLMMRHYEGFAGGRR